MYNKALAIATEAHKGQVDKVGASYILHPIRVAARCTTEDEKVVALLHDTLEDTTITAEQLLADGFPSHIVEAIKSVTRLDGETYEQFVERCSKNPIGRIVKIHDLQDNMDVTRLETISDWYIEKLKTYLKAYHFLTRL